MKNRNIFSKFLMLAFVAGVFGLTASSAVIAQFTTPATTTQINNVVPVFTVHTTESWTQAYVGSTTTDARTESSVAYPTNQGTDVVFTATATDSNADDYYLIVCDAAGVSATNNAAPTCTGTAICTSAATTEGVAATCSKSTTGLTAETHNWYSYVCDHNGDSICSAASNTSQGGTHAETGATPTPAGSPYHVNHAPTFTAATITDSTDGTIEPGDTVKFSNSADADVNVQGSQDLITLYVCPAEADQGGVTATFDFRAKNCLAADGITVLTKLCTASAVNPFSVNATCNDTQNIVSIPTAHATDYTVRYYVEDEHGFSAPAEPKDFTVQDVAPFWNSYTTTDHVNGTITAGGSDVLTRAVTFSDNNGDNDPTFVDFVFFDKAATTDACTANEKNCYRYNNINLATPPAGCSVTNRSAAGTGKTAQGTDAQLTVTCDFTIWFNANASIGWEVSATAYDGTTPGNDTNFVDSNVGSIVAALSGIAVAETSIAYGTVAVGGDSAGQTTTMQNMGNQVIDVLVSGTDMVSGSYGIPKAQQHWHHTSSTFTWNTGSFALTSPASVGADADGCLNRDLFVRTVHDAGTEDETIFWKIRIPATQESGSYSGTNTFANTASTSCTGTLN